MKIITGVLVAIALAGLAALPAAEGGGKGFSPHVDGKGNISLPRDFRATWAHLGSRAVPSQTEPGSGFHDVYTQPESLRTYRKTGKFPDGAVLVMEVRKATWDDMPTGHVVSAGDVSHWFVMVKDAKGRFEGHPNWGQGWGWAEFRAADPNANVSKDYRKDCLPCHEPARETDWVYTEGYPTLR